MITPLIAMMMTTPERSSKSETQSEGRERDDLNLNAKLMGTLFSWLAYGLASLSLAVSLFSSHPS